MDIKKAKLVIWDLDETFWDGTLTEGHVKPKKDYIKLIKTLTDRGIMNSIVSKNDFDKVKLLLEKWGIWDYFVFPQISWNPKGLVIKKLLDIIHLRAENALFLDDNKSNLEEACYYNPGIFTTEPINASLILNSPAFQGKEDYTHSRLKQYKMLEVRSEAKVGFTSNDDFLRISNIRISLCSDCLNNEERIYELIQRTNQLNYTKSRSSLKDVHSMLLDDSIECRYVGVKDNFGDYGITGFYALKDNRLIHFLFSCRTIGFGIENFIWQKLGFPKVDVVGDVATPLLKDKYVDWITINNKVSKEEVKIKQQGKILMIGGCDLDQTCAYLDTKYKVDKEFSTVVNGKEIRTSDTTSLVNILKLDDKTKKDLCTNLPFFDEEITFKSKIYSDDYDIIILSVVDDYIRGIYQSKDKNYLIGFANWFDVDWFYKNIYPNTNFDYLHTNFDFLGKEDINIFKDNLEFIRQHISQKTTLVLINGTDINVSDWIGKERVNRNIEMNQAVDEFVNTHNNTILMDIRNIVIERGQLSSKDNRHYDRNSYYLMAKELSRLITSGGGHIRIENKYVVDLCNSFSSILRRVKGKLGRMLSKL